MKRKSPKQYTERFKKEAINLMLEQGYTVQQAADALGVTTKLLYAWRKRHEANNNPNALTPLERQELLALRKEVKQLKMEKEIPKKGECLLCERAAIRCWFVQEHKTQYPIKHLCRVMKLSRSTFYAWQKHPVKPLDEDTLELYQKAGDLFKESRESLGYRMLGAQLRQEGYAISDYRTRKLMKQLGLVVKQRKRYRGTSKGKVIATADNLLNQNFNPVAVNEIWAGDITYLKTPEGWLYLSIVMDLYSRRIVGWHMSSKIDTALISKALMMAYNLRSPSKGCVFHSDRGSQYTSGQYQELLKSYDMRSSQGDVGACWDNAVVERFFGSLKHDWLFKRPHANRSEMKQDVLDYLRYYNLTRLHTANHYLSPVAYENSFRKVS
ncbi:IS3 family transposase [Pseudomonas aeruginosa]|uniref:IS3 family transposase n=1 Tax=Pseudomonas aeruginosa TaxID=287 RepID=UPI000EF6D68B|nr:IS3 family transposase [Pseudomonas aeruginosa]MBG6016031.1 IS3 family transposase [Proteus mirabilis]RLR67653.1 IS3 family transposase [Pseudomonas aeruginosa]